MPSLGEIIAVIIVAGIAALAWIGIIRLSKWAQEKMLDKF